MSSTFNDYDLKGLAESKDKEHTVSSISGD